MSRTHAKRRRLTIRRIPRAEVLEARLTPTTLPPGFVDTLVTTQASIASGTTLEISPVGEVWVLEQGGRARLIRADGTAFDTINLNVDRGGERGLLGIAFDPSYDGTGPNPDFVYLYYSVPRGGPSSPGHNRISRFEVSGAGTATPRLINESVLRDIPPEDEDNNPATDGDTNHNAGDMHFGPDGKLYVAVGDLNYDTVPQSAHPAQRLDTPLGKILRLNPDGTNPSDNPFADGSPTSWRGSIWALGLRNPYRFAIQPGTGRVFINDAGESAWEEINAGAPGANFGWAGSTRPVWEGFLSPSPPWANYRDPVMAYDHSDSPPSPAGCVITGGVFYPSDGAFGADYAGKYFFSDFCGAWIRVFDPARPGSASVPDTSTAFASNIGQPVVDVRVDAAGNLYYLTYGNAGAVHRIQFNGPTIQLQPADQTVAGGASLTFSVVAGGTGALGYQWQRLTTGGWSSIAGANQASYTIPFASGTLAGRYRVVVTDAVGSVISRAATLTVLDAPPGVVPGLRSEFYNFTRPLTRLPAFGGLRPDVVRTDARLAFPAVRTAWKGLDARFADTFASRHTGFLKIDEPGEYTLYLKSDDGSRLILDGGVVIDHNGVHGFRDRSATVTLMPGYHPIRVEYFENTGRAGLALSWSGPGIAKQLVPSSRFFQNAPAFRQSSDGGNVVIEAEHYHKNVVRGGHVWSFDTATAGASGRTAMRAAPNVGTIIDTNFVASGPRLDYRIVFTRPGIYYVWVRGFGASASDDSLHVGLDGRAVGSADRVAGFTTRFGWSRRTVDGPPARIVVTTAGVHTLNLWMREDGMLVDKIILTRSAAYVPSGSGPSESPRG
jgi:glucose/arabinose dehydrogenase